MNKKILLLIALLIVLSAIGTWFYFSYLKEKLPTVPQQGTTDQKPEKIKTTEFIPLKSQPLPAFIESLKNAEDVKMDFHYEGDYPGFSWPESEFYTPEGGEEKFLSISKLKERKDKYAYGPEYHSIFNSEGSHWYGGTPIYLLNKDSKYSVSYVGFQINNRDLISEIKIEFGIDYFAEQNLGRSKSSIFSSIFGIESVYACGPGLYLRPVGD